MSAISGYLSLGYVCSKSTCAGATTKIWIGRCKIGFPWAFWLFGHARDEGGRLSLPRWSAMSALFGLSAAFHGFGVVMLGGGYCLAGREHVRVDVFYRKYGPKARCAIEILTFLIVMTFVIAIVWKGGELCYDALLQDKRSMTILELPLFPSMVLVPIGAFLLGLQSLGHALQAVLELLSPHPETK